VIDQLVKSRTIMMVNRVKSEGFHVVLNSASMCCGGLDVARASDHHRRTERVKAAGSQVRQRFLPSTSAFSDRRDDKTLLARFHLLVSLSVCDCETHLS
jgi:hypothetical protein